MVRHRARSAPKLMSLVRATCRGYIDWSRLRGRDQACTSVGVGSFTGAYMTDRKTNKPNLSDKATTDGATSPPLDGYLRLDDVLKLFPVSRTAWWHGIREGRYPAGHKLSGRTTAWRVQDIRNLLVAIGGA